MRVCSTALYVRLPESVTQEGVSVSGTEGVLSLALDRVVPHLGNIMNPRALSITLLLLTAR